MMRESDGTSEPDIPYALLAVDLIRHIRGRWSQSAFSRRLGYRSNVVYMWESQRRSPSASRFFAAAKRMGFDVDGATARFLRRGSVPPLDTPSGVAALLTELVGEQAIGAVASRAGCSRHQISRWVKGVAEPRLPDLLRAIHGASLAVLDWLSPWADPDQLPAVRSAWRSVCGARALTRTSPWASAVLLALGLAEYRALPAHVPGWIAQRLGIGADQEAEHLDLLCAAGLVRRGRRYTPTPRPPVDLRDKRSRTDLKAFWSQVARQRLEAGASGLHTWNLFSVSAESYERIEALQRKFYADLRGEVAASEGRDAVVIAVLHLVPLTPFA